MSDWVYDWLADLAVPALSGIGGIVVGVGAVVVAYRSHGVAARSLDLAQQVRDDEQKRETDAALERYRGQLIRAVEAAVNAMLSHRAEIMKTRKIKYTAEGVLRSDLILRIWLLRAVANSADGKAVSAVSDALREAFATDDPEIIGVAEGNLALTLGSLVGDVFPAKELVKRAGETVGRARAKVDAAAKAKGSSPATPPSTSSPTSAD